MSNFDIQSDTQGNARKKKQLRMEQLAYDADIKRARRERENLATEITKFERDRDRLQVTISDYKKKEKKLMEKESFLEDEQGKIKRQLINLGE